MENALTRPQMKPSEPLNRNMLVMRNKRSSVIVPRESGELEKHQSDASRISTIKKYRTSH